MEAIEKSRNDAGLTEERAHAEARAVEYRAGDKIGLHTEQAKLADLLGDQESVRQHRATRASLIERTGEGENRKATEILDNIRKSLTQIPDIRIYEKRDIHSTLKDLGHIHNSDVDAVDMQYIAGILNTEVMTIQEPDSNPHSIVDYKAYHVVPIAKVGERNIFLTFGDGILDDHKARVFSLTDSTIKERNLVIKPNKSWPSIYPKAKTESPEDQAMSA